MANRLSKLLENFTRFKVVGSPDVKDDLPVVSKESDEIVSRLESSDSQMSSLSQLNDFRQMASDRETQYNTYDEMATDSVIAAALEIYADDATQYDEKGRIIWVESDNEEIARAGNRILDRLEIPERAWKHIYQACKYGDYYLKLYRGSSEDSDEVDTEGNITSKVKLINDKIKEADGRESRYPYDDYLEDVYDPATIFDLRKRGKTAGFVEVTKDLTRNTVYTSNNLTSTYALQDVRVFRPDRIIHIMISENMSRTPEMLTLEFEGGNSVSYEVARGKSILYDVYPIQRELQLLEDALLLNRLTRSSLIRLLEIEVGDMPKKEVNDYLRRMKNLIEQHISMDTATGSYKSYNSPGPIDNVIYIPVKKGMGHIDINSLGGDVNVRDIADIDYFNNKRSGALKIPRSFLGDDNNGSSFDNGGTLTQLSIRYARTVKRIQTSYIRAITTLLNFIFMDEDLDYVGKFQVRMTSPSTQEDLSRNDLINGNIDLVSSIMSLLESLEGDTQKKILQHLVSDVMKMPDIAAIIAKDKTPSEDVMIDGDLGGPGMDGPDFGGADDFSDEEGTSDISDMFGDEESPSDSGDDIEGGFTDAEYASFEDEL